MPDATRLRDLFDRAIELPDADRDAFLDAECGHGELRSAVDRLLTAYRNAGTLFETDSDPAPADAITVGDTPVSVGPYRLLQEIGRGGMGTVYRAVRSDEEYTKEVAVKLLRRGLESQDMIRRFRNERQILATIEHPFIARLLDGGTTEGGLPYLVMEYVAGERLDRFVESRALSIDQRLDLFRKICAAAHFAHQNLVVHRDLKPTNILVTADGSPKLLDFGIAKLLTEDRLPAAGATTVAGGRAMTPEYASPEQVKGLPITTGSDVYSLGVLLYELLTGQRPFRPRSNELYEVGRAICEDEPSRPSTVAEPTAGVDAGRGAAAKLRRKLRGDLDHIVLKAIRKEPDRRYTSAEQLADDVTRYLEGRPVRARKGTWRYRTGKYVSRHRLAVAAVTVAAASLIVFSSIAIREGGRARREADKATAINQFLQQMMTSANPLDGVRHDVTVREVLADAVKKLGGSFEAAPDVKAAVLNTVGLTYLRLGQHAEAEGLLREALTLRERLLGGDHLGVAEVLTNLSDVLVERENDEEAERLAHRAVAIRRDQLGVAHPLTAQAYKVLANIYFWRSDYVRAEAAYRQALESRRGSPASDPLDIAEALNDLAIVTRRQGNYPDAERLYRDAIALHGRHGNMDRADAAATLTNLAILLQAQRRLAEAEPLARRALEIRQRTLGPGHHMVANSLQTLGLVIDRKGDLPGAERLFRQALEIQQRVYREHEWVAHSLRVLGVCLSRQGKHREAEDLLRQSLTMRKKVLGEDNAEVADGLHQLGGALRRQGAYAQAERHYREALTMRRRLLPASHPDLADNLTGLAQAVDGLRDARQANALFEESLAMLEKADPYGRMPEFRLFYGQSLLGQRRFSEAETQLRAALALLERGDPPDRQMMAQVARALVDVYGAWGKPAEERQYRELAATVTAAR